MGTLNFVQAAMGTYSHHINRLPWSCFTQTWTGWRHTPSQRHRHWRRRTETQNWDNSGSGCNRLPVLLSQCKSSSSFSNSGRTSKHVKSHWTSLQSNQTETPNNNTHCYGKLTCLVHKHFKIILPKLSYLNFSMPHCKTLFKYPFKYSHSMCAYKA